MSWNALGLLELLYFVAFCYLANRWSNTDSSWLEEKGFEQWQRRNARSVIFFAFVALLAWVRVFSPACMPTCACALSQTLCKISPFWLQWSHSAQIPIFNFCLIRYTHTRTRVAYKQCSSEARSFARRRPLTLPPALFYSLSFNSTFIQGVQINSNKFFKLQEVY